MPTHENIWTDGYLHCNGIKIGRLTEVPAFTCSDEEINDDEAEMLSKELRDPANMTFSATFNALLSDRRAYRNWRRINRWFRKFRQQAKRKREKERKKNAKLD